MTPAAHPLAPEQRAAAQRDVASLVVCLLLVTGPHLLRAPAWLAALVLSLFAWRGVIALRRAGLPPLILLLAITGLALLGMWLEYRTLFGRTTGIMLLTLFSGLKLLEMRTHRDATIVVFLCCFLIITNLLYNQSIPTAALMGAALGAIVTTLIGFNAPQRPVRANLRTAGLLLAHAAPAALVLFLLFPRVQGPMWGLPQDAVQAMTGLSDTMSPGGVSQLAQSDAIAFRAAFVGEAPPARELYWRGPVLWDFDGRTWRIGDTWLEPFRAPAGEGRHEYNVVLEPHNRPWMFALESAASLPGRTRYTHDGQLLAVGPIRTRIQYDMVSIARPAPRATETRSALERALRLPEAGAPRARRLAAEWRAAAASDLEVAQRAIDYFRANKFVYTLEPAVLAGDAVDEFLFETREGFCEHYSSAFVFLMRAAGVPARVVTGYQGGDPNPIDRIVTVRQWDAHAWAEVYLAGRGWVRVDPTAAAAPGRIEAGLARGVRAGETLPLMMQSRLDWLRPLRYQWEALAHRWNVWVLGYNPERQRELMRFVGMRDADWRTLTAAMFTILGALTLVLLVWSLRQLVRPDPVQRAWRTFCRKLAASGVARAPNEGPRDFSERAARARPRADEAIRRIGELYIALRYGRRTGDAAETAQQAELRRAVRELRLT